MRETGLTPMMRQYLGIKENNRDSILFFRLGDFYEMFFDDAREASKILHITLTSREAGKDNKVPMCGVPYHAADNYIARLIRSGRKVAICEQVEEPSAGKQLVDREIIKIVTPGTFMADEILDASKNNFLLSIFLDGGRYGLAYSDISTGEFRVTEVETKDDFLAEICKISPSECLIPEGLKKSDNFSDIKDITLGVITTYHDWIFDYDFSTKEIKNHFLVNDLSGFGCQDMPLAVRAAGALLKYLKDTQKSTLKNITGINTYNINHFMTLDFNSQRNLELIQNMDDLSENGTLLDVFNGVKTPMGKRRLKKWILNPLVDYDMIMERIDAVEWFIDTRDNMKKIREILEDIYDIDRLSNKVSLGSANARDMIALSSSLKRLNDLKKYLTGEMPLAIENIKEGIDNFDDCVSLIDSSISEDPPVTVKEGGIIKSGFSAEIDELRDIINGGKDWLMSLKTREIERTGIHSLKIGYNRVFGYYIEITNSNLESIPKDYIRKQTLVNAERFITDELKKYESKIIGAEERVKTLEYEIFCDIRSKVGHEIERLKNTADKVSDLDVLAIFAETAEKNNYTRPEINTNGDLIISDGRHPVIEKLLKDKEFVPNDINMSKDGGNLFIITGSNMAGKSTFIRQVALITVMGQMGSFVPAKNANISIVDRVFTRVGASDRLHKGMSTFMVEMLETSNILNNATGKSLIILDEIGRGTSTFDGVSIAWAVMEYIHKHISGAKTLFATHFHELTELAEILDNVRNFHLEVKEWRDTVIFLYKVARGNSDESFGVHVAQLAGMPKDVIKRAREILNNLQKDSLIGNIRAKFAGMDKSPEKQFNFFEKSFIDDPIIDKIREIDVNKMTPIEALEKLMELKKEIDNRGR